MVLGFVAEVIAWSLVARGRNVWTTMTPVSPRWAWSPWSWVRSPGRPDGGPRRRGRARARRAAVRGHPGRDGDHGAVGHVPATRARDVPQAGQALARDRAPLSIALSVPGRSCSGAGSSRASSRRLEADRARGTARGSRSCSRTSRARTWRSRPARWSAARSGSPSRGGRRRAREPGLPHRVDRLDGRVPGAARPPPSDDVSEVVRRRSVGSSRRARSATSRRSRRPVRT